MGEDLMKRLLLLLPLLCFFNARPVFAVDWAVWLSGVYCQAREAGFNHQRAIEMMNYEAKYANGGYAILRDQWQKAQSENEKLTSDIVYSKVKERYSAGVCG